MCSKLRLSELPWSEALRLDGSLIPKIRQCERKIEGLRCDLGNLKKVREVFSCLRENKKRLDTVRAIYLLTMYPSLKAHFCKLLLNGINTAPMRMMATATSALTGLATSTFLHLRGTFQLPETRAPRIVFERPDLQQWPLHLSLRIFGMSSAIRAWAYELYGCTKLAMVLGTKYGLYK